MKLAIVLPFKKPGWSSKHVERGPVDAITHLQRSLVWVSDTLKGPEDLLQCLPR